MTSQLGTDAPDANETSRPRGVLRRVLRFAAGVLFVLIIIVIAAGCWATYELRASLPVLDGSANLPGLSASVTISRDALGVPTISGASRVDVARATGFVHGQDRFFQMDLLRRKAAGELSELFGPAALPLDRATRIHGFRAEAGRVIAAAEPDEKALVEAYAEGVNAGLASLRARPFEYLALRTKPAPWTPEDTVLVVLSMFLELQDDTGAIEAARGAMHDHLPPALFQFLTQRGTTWDAPLEGGPLPEAPLPGPEDVDLRTIRRGAAASSRAIPDFMLAEHPAPFAGSPSWANSSREAAAASHTLEADLGASLMAPRVFPPLASGSRECVAASGLIPLTNGTREDLAVGGIARTRLDRGALADDPSIDDERSLTAGSNNWAVAGRFTADGGALLANDMHLGHSVPNIWYRASLVWPATDTPGALSRVTGVTLPGTPIMVVGSNGHVAWGFTNTHADWSDVVIVETDPKDVASYRTPDGPRKFERTIEAIHVSGRTDEQIEVTRTIWGPIVGKDDRQRPLAIHWTAHDPSAVDFHLVRLEGVRDLDAALAAANRCGIPGQNFVAADARGRVGWTIAGAIPRRTGFDGRLPASWADGTHRWDGWLDPASYPRVVDPPSGRIWTANARVVDGAMLDAVGDGGYDVGARAGQIRDDLLALDRANARDMLAVQLDNRALFLARWRDLLLAALSPGAVSADPRRGDARKLVESWGGRAAIDSAGYRIVRAFRSFFSAQVLEALARACDSPEPCFDPSDILQAEGPLWKLVSERPAHLLNPKFKTWDEQILAAIDASIASLTKTGPDLAHRTWGERNTARIQHPLSLAVPLLGRLLDMPADQLAGDNYMPRVQTPAFGPSERMVVSPGSEADGFFHMPCGQSGHPLSPFYRNGHAAWVRGEPTPFLPGPAIHTLTLTPAPDR